MSINTATVDSSSGLVLYQGEKLLTRHTGIKLSLEAGGGYPGAGGSFYCPTGCVFLTNFRIVYLVTDSSIRTLKTVDMPLPHVKGLKMIQPLWGANEIDATVIPVPVQHLGSSGAVDPTMQMTGPSRLKMTFKDGGASEFHSMYMFTMSASQGNQIVSPVWK